MSASDSSIDSRNTANGKLFESAPVESGSVPNPAPQAEAQGFEEVLKRLSLLKNLNKQHEQNISVIDSLYVHGITTVEARLRSLLAISLPIPQKSRQLIRSMQDLLEALVKLLLNPETVEGAEKPDPADTISPLAIWRVLRLLSRHLLISSLTAVPPGTGIWRQLHQVYAVAAQQDIAHLIPEKAPRSPKDEYYTAILLGCVQPTSFTGRDVFFLSQYLERFSGQIDINVDEPVGNPAMFWANPESDAPAVPYSRMQPLAETPVFNFSCRRLASVLENQLAALESGTPPKWTNLPPFAATSAGLGVLNRLIRLLGNPGTRRFPRRSQNYRGELCFGFDNLHRLYKRNPEPVETSAWMITNESPDGYAVMHLSGKTQAITVGDIAAVRTETGDRWELCIIRWALSENLEHIELGLQILAPRAYAADIFLPASTKADVSHHPSFVLPAAPTLRQSEVLVVPSGTLDRHSKNLVLLIERNNVEVREIGSIRCDERNGLIELYEITTLWS